jgi:hypothetical protein
VSNNLVDGSGGAIGSTGDILVVRSHVDGNTTDGDGGALYADEDGDVTVIDSTVDGSTADGPGGGIFTLAGDVTVVGSTLNGNRADDRGGAIAGEGNTVVINSTIARNGSVAHVGGGISGRGDVYVANSTISDNYAEGEGGGILGAGDVGLVYSTVIDNIAPVAGNVGVARRLYAFGSVIGPARTVIQGGEVQPTGVNCRTAAAQSSGYNVVTDGSCGLIAPTDTIGAPDPMLAPLAQNGGRGESRMPVAGSPAVDRIPPSGCLFRPFGPVREGDQHLEGHVADRLALMAADQRGAGRPAGAGCDVGAAEAGAAVAAAAQWAPSGPSRAVGAGVGPVSRPGPAVRPGPTRPPAPRSASRRASAASSAMAAGTALRPTERRVRRLERQTAPMMRLAADYRVWRTCLRPLPVSEYGDPDGRFGFVYDGRDGTGPGPRAVLTIDRTSRPRREDYLFLHFSRARRCRSAPPAPGGTAEPARAHSSNGATVTNLEARVRRLWRQSRRLDRAAERFDAWESCISQIPVTEYGDADGDFGFYFGRHGSRVHGYRPAIAFDRSDWDDPDYVFLAFANGERPSGECDSDPGEGIGPEPGAESDAVRGPRPRASASSASSRATDVRQELNSLEEEIEDRREEIGEFALFDQCMYLIGVSPHGSRSGSRGYWYRGGDRPRRQALALDLRTFGVPRYDLLAFPGEEPPGIECNEDAEPEFVDG